MDCQRLLDTYSLVWYVDDYYIEDILNCAVSYSDEEYEVDGLDEVGTVDVFDGMDVSFTGTSPMGNASLTIGGQFSQGGYSLPYQWTVTPDSGLANGDAVTVSFEMADESAFISQYGAVPEYTEKEYTVEGLDSYVTDISQLSDENMAALKSEALDQVEAKFGESSVTSIGFGLGNDYYHTGTKGSDYRLDNVYFLVEKSSDLQVYYTSAVVFIYSVSFSASNKTLGYEFDGRVYYAVSFMDLILEDDGNVVGISNAKISNPTGSLDSVYQNYVMANKDNYNITVYDADLNVVK